MCFNCYFKTTSANKYGQQRDVNKRNFSELEIKKLLSVRESKYYNGIFAATDPFELDSDEIYSQHKINTLSNRNNHKTRIAVITNNGCSRSLTCKNECAYYENKTLIAHKLFDALELFILSTV